MTQHTAEVVATYLSSVLNASTCNICNDAGHFKVYLWPGGMFVAKVACKQCHQK